MNLIETDWIKDIRLGNLKAFDSLFKSYYASLCIYATDIIKDKNLAEEIVQDVFLKLWNSRATIQINSSVKAYLYRMVHNYTLNYIRDNFSELKANSISIDDISNRTKILNLKSSYTIMDEIMIHQIEQELNEAIAGLPPQCRDIFCLARFQRLSYSEIATKLEISVSTVKSQMLRSIDKLKLAMEHYLK